MNKGESLWRERERKGTVVVLTVPRGKMELDEEHPFSLSTESLSSQQHTHQNPCQCVCAVQFQSPNLIYLSIYVTLIPGDYVSYTLSFSLSIYSICPLLPHALEHKPRF